MDRGVQGLSSSPSSIISEKISATFINIRGNHDTANNVKSLCDSMQLHLGSKFPDVTAGHYPSYDPRAAAYIRPGWINLCGHVHHLWKHCLDIAHGVLNINMSVDVWGVKIVSEDMLIKYIESILRLPKSKLNIKQKAAYGKRHEA